jgi:hypothetical protein
MNAARDLDEIERRQDFRDLPIPFRLETLVA